MNNSIIRRVHLEARNEPIVPLAEKVLVTPALGTVPVTLDGDTYGINVDAPYQREPVWGVERQRNLIRSILMGLPIGALTFNERRYPEWRVCIDGKQRLLAVRAFAIGELFVPSEWFEDKHIGADHKADLLVNRNRLTTQGWRVFDAQAITVTHTAKIREAEVVAAEAELFSLINYGGVPQGKTDLPRIKSAR